MQQHLPVLLIITPLVAAPLCLLLRQRVAALALALAVCWSTFAMALWLLDIARNTPGGITYQLGGWAAGPPRYRVFRNTIFLFESIINSRPF